MSDIFKLFSSNEVFNDELCYTDRTTLNQCADRTTLSQLPYYIFYNTNPKYSHVPRINRVMYNDRATIVEWDDDTKTVVKCFDEEDNFDKEVGLAMAIARKYFEFNGHSSTPRADFMHCVKSATVYSEPSEKIDEDSLFEVSKNTIEKAVAKFNKPYISEFNQQCENGDK